MATEEKQSGGIGNAGAWHGGRLAARALAERGVSHLFTLSGGHLFSLYDGCGANSSIGRSSPLS